MLVNRKHNNRDWLYLIFKSSSGKLPHYHIYLNARQGVSLKLGA